MARSASYALLIEGAHVRVHLTSEELHIHQGIAFGVGSSEYILFFEAIVCHQSVLVARPQPVPGS